MFMNNQTTNHQTTLIPFMEPEQEVLTPFGLWAGQYPTALLLSSRYRLLAIPTGRWCGLLLQNESFEMVPDHLQARR